MPDINSTGPVCRKEGVEQNKAHRGYAKSFDAAKQEKVFEWYPTRTTQGLRYFTDIPDAVDPPPDGDPNFDPTINLPLTCELHFPAINNLKDVCHNRTLRSINGWPVCTVVEALNPFLGYSALTLTQDPQNKSSYHGTLELQNPEGNPGDMVQMSGGISFSPANWMWVGSIQTGIEGASLMAGTYYCQIPQPFFAQNLYPPPSGIYDCLQSTHAGRCYYGPDYHLYACSFSVA